MWRRRSSVSFDSDKERAKKRSRVSDKDRIGSEMKRTEKEDRRDARHGRVGDLKGITDLRHRSNVSFDSGEERAKKRSRVSDKDRIGSERKHTEKEDRRDARHGRADDLMEITNMRHGFSGGERYQMEKESFSKRYKEQRWYGRKENSSTNRKYSELDISREDQENIKPGVASVREPVSRSRELLGDRYKRKYRHEKQSNVPNRYRDEKYKDQRPEEKYQDSSSYRHERYTHKHSYKEEKHSDYYRDGAERERRYNRKEHKYVEEGLGTKCEIEISRGKERLYAEKGCSGDLKSTSAKEMCGELDKHVSRPGVRKVGYLLSDIFHQRVSKSGTMLMKGQSRKNNQTNEEEEEKHSYKVLSPIPERPNSPLYSQNNRTSTYPFKTLRYSQPWFAKTKDSMMENLTCSGQPSAPSTPSNYNGWNRNEEVPSQYWGSQRLGIRAGDNAFYSYGGWENGYNYYLNTSYIGNINNVNNSWNKTSNVPLWPLPVPNSSTCCSQQVPRSDGIHSTVQQWASGFRSEITEWGLNQVAYNSDGEMNPFLSKPNPLFWQGATIQQTDPSAATADEAKPNRTAFPILESAEPKKPDTAGLSVSASDRPPDLNTRNSVKNDSIKSTKHVERTPFHHVYYLSKIGLSSDLATPDLYQKCMSILQKSGAEKTSGSACSKSLLDDKGLAKKSSNGILKHIFPANTNAVFQKSMSRYTATTGKCIMLNRPATSTSLGGGERVADASVSTGKKEVKMNNEEKPSIEVCSENHANSDKKQIVSAAGDSSHGEGANSH